MPPHLIAAVLLLLLLHGDPELIAAVPIVHTGYSSAQLRCGGSGPGSGGGSGSGRGLRAQSVNESCPILLNLGRLSIQIFGILGLRCRGLIRLCSGAPAATSRPHPAAAQNLQGGQVPELQRC